MKSFDVIQNFGDTKKFYLCIHCALRLCRSMFTVPVEDKNVRERVVR